MSGIDLYKQVPLIKSDHKCSVCGKTLSARKPAKIWVYGQNARTHMEVEAELLFCSICQIHYATGSICGTIRHKNRGLSACGFIPNKGDTVEHVLFKSNEFPVCYKSCRKVSNEHRQKMSRPRPQKGIKLNTTIFLTSCNLTACPICYAPLDKSVIIIPISAAAGVEYSGSTCGNHFFMKSSKDLRNLMIGNSYASGIHLDDSYLFPYYNEALADFRSDNDQAVMLFLKNMCDGTLKTVIITNQPNAVHDNGDVLNYMTKPARHLLTQIVKDRRTEIMYRNEKYCVLSKEYNRVGHGSQVRDFIIKNVRIKSEGGYRDSIKNSKYELVDVLLFSPYTEIYELCHATYDKDNDDYFMDISVYRGFVREYGNPSIGIYVENGKSGRMEFLNEESLLYAYGYNVSQTNNLSDNVRQEILADLIDLKHMTPSGIAKFIENLISLHSGDKDTLARSKWAHDVKFVRGYKANPERFIIAMQK